MQLKRSQGEVHLKSFLCGSNFWWRLGAKQRINIKIDIWNNNLDFEVEKMQQETTEKQPFFTKISK